jgi:hypothetical protein
MTIMLPESLNDVILLNSFPTIIDFSELRS